MSDEVKIISVTVKNKIAQIDNPDVCAVCSNSDYVVRFTFDEEWNAYNTKTARFKYNGMYEDKVFTGNDCPLPIIENALFSEIGVYAGDLHTTTGALLPMRRSILSGGDKHTDPPEDVYNQLTELVNEQLNSADNAADRAEASAEEAKKSEISADDSEAKATQALADLLKMLGTDIAPLVNGMLPMSIIPATATQEIYEISSEEDLVSLVAQRGDLAELVEVVDGERTITKTWQLLGNDPTVADNWVVWGTSYAVQAGNATQANNALNSAKINNHRIIEMTYEAFESAVKDDDTYYFIYNEAVTE